MDFARCLYSNALMEFPSNHMVQLYTVITVPSLISCFFCENFSCSPSSTKIHVQNQFHQGQSREISLLNMARYRKAVSSALWVQLALNICYLPIVIVEALTIQGSSLSVVIAKEFAVALLYLHSTLNPILYCWKLNEVRKAVKGIIEELRCLFCLRR